MDDLIGFKTGRLEVISYSHTDKYRLKKYLCICICGNKKIVSSKNLRNKITLSCGCLQKEIISKYCKENNYKKIKVKVNELNKSESNSFIYKENYDLKLNTFIYKITNIINKKIYIGQCGRNLKQHICRYRNVINKKGKLTPIERAIVKYGLGNFLFEIIELSKKENILNRESELILYFNSTSRKIGYNISIYSSSSIGIKRSEDAKIKLSNLAKLRTGNKNPFYGKKHSTETILKIIESNKNRKGNKNTPHKEITKLKISKTKKESGSAIGIKNPNARLYKITYHNGEKTEFIEGFTEFCKKNKLSPTGLKSASKIKKSYKGFICEITKIKK